MRRRFILRGTAGIRWQSSCKLPDVVDRSQRRGRLPIAANVANRAHGARMKSILDPTFRYTSSANTDLRKTFARIRRESRRQTSASACEDAESLKKVTPIFRGQRPAA
jgi:hypothetical protein